jgi:four helix bundle protein
MNAQQLQQRTKEFALRNLRLFRSLPRSNDAQIIGKQMLRAAMSTAANYRAACRARSHAEFVAKLCIVVEEIDETQFWIEIVTAAGWMKPRRLRALNAEASELTAIFTASRHTAQGSRSRKRSALTS